MQDFVFSPNINIWPTFVMLSHGATEVSQGAFVQEAVCKLPYGK